MPSFAHAIGCLEEYVGLRFEYRLSPRSHRPWPGEALLRPIFAPHEWAAGHFTRRNKPGNPYYAGFEYIAFPEVEGAPLRHSVAILSQLHRQQSVSYAETA